jgi:hypothetical protein
METKKGAVAVAALALKSYESALAPKLLLTISWGHFDPYVKESAASSTAAVHRFQVRLGRIATTVFPFPLFRTQESRQCPCATPIPKSMFASDEWKAFANALNAALARIAQYIDGRPLHRHHRTRR